MINKLSKVLQLSWGHRLELIQAWLALLRFDLALRTTPFTRLQRLIIQAQNRSAPPQAEPVPVMIERYRRLVEAASRNHLYPMTCLRRALALQWMLARRGIIAELRIGVQRQAKTLQAHAWLELGGVPISDPETITERFTTLTAQKKGR